MMSLVRLARFLPEHSRKPLKVPREQLPFSLGGSRQSRVKMPFPYLGELREQFNAIDRASMRDDLSVRS